MHATHRVVPGMKGRAPHNRPPALNSPTVTSPQPLSAQRALGIAVLFIACYVFLSWATRFYMVRPLAITPWNPAAGLGLALLLVFGLRFWPALAIASCLSNFLVRELPLHLNLIIPAVITSGYAGMAWLLLGPLGFRVEFNRLRDISALAIVATVGTLLIAATSVSILSFHDAMAEVDMLQVGVKFWIGHLVGIAVNTPLLLLLLNDWACISRTLQQRSRLEIAAQLGAVIVTLWAIFGLAWTNEYKFFYLLFLPLIWIVVRHGIVGAALGIAVIQLGLIAAVESSGYPVVATVTEFQFMMLVLAVTGLLLGMAVTVGHAAHDALNHSESRLRTIVATAPDGIITVDKSGAIVGTNPAALNIFGFAESGLLGTSVHEVLPEFERVARLKEPSEATGLRRGGSRFPVEVSVGTAGGEAQELRIAIVRDTARRKEVEFQLAQKQAEINRMARLAAAGETAAALAHELHQPLAAIRNYAHAAQMLAHGAARDELMHKLGREAGRAAEVVQRLRDFFSSGASRLERVRLRDLLDAAMAPMRGEAVRNDIEMKLETECGELTLLVDRVQVEAVIHSLIGNAMDAIAAAKGDLRQVRVIAKEEDAALIRVSVIDTGPGISQAMIARLFEPFATTKAEGTGFGLAMSRSLVEAHGGSLWAEAGSGGVFHFTLPRAEPKECRV